MDVLFGAAAEGGDDLGVIVDGVGEEELLEKKGYISDNGLNLNRGVVTKMSSIDFLC